MLKQIKLLAKLRLINFMGINVARCSRDSRKKRYIIAMMAVYALLAAVLMGYVGLLCWGMVKLGAGRVVPLALAALSGLVVLVFTVLRAGPMLFDLRDYEMLISLPLRPAAVIISRFLSMYVSNAALCLGVLLPGMAVCGAMLEPAFLYYPMMLLGALILPLIPMTIAMLLGMLVYMLSSRMKRKNLAALLLSLLATLAVMFLPMWLGSMQPDRLILSINALLDGLRGFYPPAGWFGDAVSEANLSLYLAFSLGSIAFFGLGAWLMGRRYASICTALANHHSKRNFRMAAQRSRSAFFALYRREFKRFLASPVYVMNCGMGYLFAVIIAGALLFEGVYGFMDDFPIPLELAPRMIVFILAFFYSISPSTVCAISMEGRQWWIAKSLPLSRQQILLSKILVNFTIALPCWAISTLFLLLSMKPAGFIALWLVLLPLAYILFSSILGLRLNLKMPIFNWENETVPVKQGKSMLFNLLIALIGIVIPAFCLVYAPEGLRDAVSAVIFALLLLGSGLLYRGCMGCRLEDIN